MVISVTTYCNFSTSKIETLIPLNPAYNISPLCFSMFPHFLNSVFFYIYEIKKTPLLHYKGTASN